MHLQAKEDLSGMLPTLPGRCAASSSRSLRITARMKLVYVEKPYAIWRARNAARERAVPVSVLNRLLGKLEVPTTDEAHEVG